MWEEWDWAFDEAEELLRVQELAPLNYHDKKFLVDMFNFGVVPLKERGVSDAFCKGAAQMCTSLYLQNRKGYVVLGPVLVKRPNGDIIRVAPLDYEDEDLK